MTDFEFPSELETLVLSTWSRDENGVLRAEYPNGAGFMLLRNETVEYWEVCSNGEYVLAERGELKVSVND